MKFLSAHSMRMLGLNIRILFGPLLMISIIAVLFVYLLMFGLKKVSSEISAYNELNNDISVFRKKLSSLQEIKEGIVDQADKTVIALPNRNSAIFTLSQIESLAQESNITLNSIRFTQISQKDGINSMGLKLSITGSDVQSVFDFIKKLYDIAPITTISSGNLSGTESAGEISAGFDMLIYWSDFPTQIPPISAPLVELSDKEKELLSKVNNLKSPLFVILEPQPPAERSQPFN